MSGHISVNTPNTITLTIGKEGSSVFDYKKALNKPKINGVELNGDLTTEDLQIIAGGGVDYEQMTNKPQIEGVELSGNRTFEQLGIKPMSVSDIEKLLYLP